MASEEADALIAQVAHGARSPGPDAERLIREHMAKAPFLSHASVVEHVAKRIRQHQWHDSVTPDEYISDLRAAVRAALQLGVYVRRAGTLAVAVALTEAVVPPSRVGTESAGCSS